MNRLLYYLLLPILYFLSILPFWILYRLSDIVFLLVYYVAGYRKKVVLTNLRRSFPEKPEREIRRISRRFYAHFCDLIFETLKLLTIRPETLRKRMRFENAALLEQLQREQKSVILLTGHNGNWEWAGVRFSIEPVHQYYAIYHPIRNPSFEKLVYHMRTRLGAKLYTMKEALRGMMRNRKQLTATAFIADQTPSHKNVYWTEFLNQDTPVFVGAERIAKMLRFPVVYLSVRRLRRGHYAMRAEMMFANPEITAENEISETYTRWLERDIQAQPETWLWTHRRWKHKRDLVEDGE